MKYTSTLFLFIALFISARLLAGVPAGGVVRAGGPHNGHVNTQSQTSPPHITYFTPTQADSGAFVYIHGLNFTNVTSVSFGGVSSPYFIAQFDTLIYAQVGNGHSGYVVVTTPGGTDSVAGFTFLTPGPKPTVTEFIPTTGKTGDTILVRGHAFTNASMVSFGWVGSSGFSVLNDSVLWAIVGSGARGPVAVTNPGGTGSLDGFTYISSPAPPIHLLSFSPDSGRTNDTVFIRGTGLSYASTVSFGGVNARSFYAFSDSFMLAIIDTGATGAVRVSGTNGTDSLWGFVYIPTPKDTSTPPPPPPATFELLDFRGVDSSGGILLNWFGINDYPVIYYFIYRGSDSAHISTLAGTVTSARSSYADYAYQDNAHLSGTQYYQLKMEDSTGNFSFGPIISVSLPVAADAIRTYPNPAVSAVTVAVPPTNTSSWFLLSDPSGRVIRTVAVPPNTRQVTIDVTGLTKGLYKIGWSDGSRKSGGSIFIAK